MFCYWAMLALSVCVDTRRARINTFKKKKKKDFKYMINMLQSLNWKEKFCDNVFQYKHN